MVPRAISLTSCSRNAGIRTRYESTQLLSEGCQDELEKSIDAYVTFELSDLYI